MALKILGENGEAKSTCLAFLNQSRSLVAYEEGATPANFLEGITIHARPANYHKITDDNYQYSIRRPGESHLLSATCDKEALKLAEEYIKEHGWR